MVLDIIKVQRYSFYKLIILMSALFFLVISINSIASDVSSTYKNDYARRVEINIKNNSIKQGKLIRQSDLKNLKTSFSKGSIISYKNEMDTLVETEHMAYPAKAVHCGEDLDKFLDIDLIRGRFFSAKQYEDGSKVAVISDTMAYKFFMTHDVIGNEIKISGVKYKIVGLYKNNSSLFSFLSSDGMDKIYIPFNSIASIDEKSLNTIFVKDVDLEAKPFKVHTVENALAKLGVDTLLYEINDFYDIHTFLSQPLSLVIFIVGIYCICILIKYLIKYLKFVASNLKCALKDNYFLGMLAKSKLRMPIFIILTALIIGFIGTVFWIVKFKGAIPYEYIPVDNVFDFEFYTGIIKDLIYSSNNSVGYVPTQLEMLFSKSLIAVYALMLLLILSFISVMSSIKLNKLVSESFVKQMLGMLVSVIIGLVISFVVCLACGIQLSFPIKEMAVLVLLFIIKFVDEKRVDNFSVKLSEKLSDDYRC